MLISSIIRYNAGRMNFLVFSQKLVNMERLSGISSRIAKFLRFHPCWSLIKHRVNSLQTQKHSGAAKKNKKNAVYHSWLMNSFELNSMISAGAHIDIHQNNNKNRIPLKCPQKTKRRSWPNLREKQKKLAVEEHFHSNLSSMHKSCWQAAAA